MQSKSLVVFAVLALAACSQPAKPPSAAAAASTPSDSIPVSLSHYMSSGLANQFPGVIVIEGGRVVAFRYGTEQAHGALAGIRKGEAVADGQPQRSQTQAALDRLLAAEHRPLQSLLGPDGKALIFVAPGNSLGECPPCSALFDPIDANAVIAGYKVNKIAVEQG